MVKKHKKFKKNQGDVALSFWHKIKNKEAKKNPHITQYIWITRALARPIFAKK